MLFRIGATGCTLEASVLDNVRFLGPLVDDVELIMWRQPNGTLVPTAQELAVLKELAEEYELSYTIHLPCGLGLASSASSSSTSAASLSAEKEYFLQRIDEAWVESRCRDTCQAIAQTLALKPKAYVWHWESENFALVPAADCSEWLARIEQLAKGVVQSQLCSPELLCVETLSYDYAYVWPLVQELGLSVTLDIGHLWRSKQDCRYWTEQLLPRTRVAHLHGVSGLNTSQVRDHVALQPENLPQLRQFLKAWCEHCLTAPQEMVLTLELFSVRALEQSLPIVRRLCGEIVEKQNSLDKIMQRSGNHS